MTEHARGRAGAEHLDMIDMRSARAQRVRQRQHLAPRTGAADPAAEANGVIDQRFQPEPLRQCRHEEQPRVRDQVRVIKGGVDPVKRVRYSRH